jgi:hypothetical protein
MIKSRRIGWLGHVILDRKFRDAYSVVMQKTEGNTPL